MCPLLSLQMKPPRSLAGRFGLAVSDAKNITRTRTADSLTNNLVVGDGSRSSRSASGTITPFQISTDMEGARCQSGNGLLKLLIGCLQEQLRCLRRRQDVVVQRDAVLALNPSNCFQQG